MPFRPFQNEFADHRVVVIPAHLDNEQRARFITKVAAAVKQQANLAAKCDAILRVSGTIEQAGDRIVVPHEPAAPGDSGVIESAPEPPGINVIWWLSWSVVRALKAAAPGSPHGGIQAETLYLDQAGRVKLGDFGVAPVFEAICGSDARRQIHCDGTVRQTGAGRACSGVWSLLGEEEVRDHGWIAPYFAHELLEGTLRLNPKSDQFAAGTLLFLLATGAHPYGASLSDPTLMLYFHLEPFAVGDERPEWEEVFQRQERDFSTAADQPILAWSEFIQKLLDADPGERFANAGQAEAAIVEFCPTAWPDASGAISAALKLLDAGDADAFLQKVAPWRDAEGLPVLWREQLSRWVAGIEARKEEIGAYKRLEQRLAEGQQALNSVEVERAREIAREVLAAPQCDEVLRAGAKELIEFCDEQEEFIRSGADDLAKAYLESAGECLARHEFDQARQLLNGLLNDPATPSARAAHARQLIAEVELTEQRIEQQTAELSGAGDELREGHYQAARQRLEALLEEEKLPEAIATQARALLDDVAQAQARRAACVSALDAARTAWERADLDALEEHLAKVPDDFADPEIADVRADLTSRRDPLRTALGRRAAAEAAIAASDPQAALARAEQARDVAELPQILRDQLDELVQSCRSAIEERERARIEQALELSRQAEVACEALRIEECRQLLRDDVITQPGLPEDIVAKAVELLRRCERVEKAQTRFEHARQHLADGAFQDASVLLDGLSGEGLPSAVVADLQRLREEVAQAREEHVKRVRQKLAAQLDEIDALVRKGELDDAESSLKPVEASGELSAELRRRIAATRATIAKQRPLLNAIRAAEAALCGEPSDLAKLLATLERLPAELPDWAPPRIEAVKKRAAELAERRRREMLQRAAAALDAAETALDAGEVSTGRGRLDEAGEAVGLDRALAERHERLTARLAQLEHWLPKVRAASDVMDRGDFARAHRELGELLSADAIPELCRAQLAQLKERTEKRIAARQQEIDAELGALAAVLARRGRRARKFPHQVGGLRADPLATEQHHAQADQLLAEYERLPEPKTPKVPLAIAGGVGAVVVVVAGLYFGGVFSGGDEDGGRGISKVQRQTPTPPTQPPPEESPTSTVAELPTEETPAATQPKLPEEATVVVDDVRKQIGAALTRLRAELAEAAEQARAQGRFYTEWQLEFQPGDELPTSLLAVDPSQQERDELGAAGSVAELELLWLTPELIDRLFPVPAPPTEPPIAARIAAALESFQTEVDTARADAGRPDAPAPRFVVRLEPPESLPATLIARNEQTTEEIRLGEVTEEELDELSLTDEFRQQIFPPLAPEKPSVAEVAKAYLDELRQVLPRAAVNEELLPTGEGTFEIGVQWNERDLRALSGLRFDAQEARFEPPVASAAEYFRLQIEALDALTRPLTMAIAAVDADEAAYDAALRLAEPLQDVIVKQVDSQARRVGVEAAVKLERDPRALVSFPFGAVYAGGKFAIDDGTRSAFDAYLRDLQKHQLQDSLEGIDEELGLPTGVRLSWPGDFAGGSRVTLRVQGADDHAFGTLEARWHRETLLYEIDTGQALVALRASVRAAARDQGVRRRLMATWSGMRATLAPPADQPGVKYFGRCDLLELAVAEDQPDEPFAVAVVVTIGPRDAVGEQRIRFPARLTVREGVLTWDPDAAREAKATIVARLQGLARSERFRAARRQAALTQLASQVGVDPASMDVQAEGDELHADLVAAGRRRSFTWTWDSADLGYAGRVESAPRVLSLDDRLGQLALQPTSEIGAFRDALGEVTRAKIARYGASGYALAEGLAKAAPADGLIAVGAALQRLTAPVPTRDPFPVVFIEYFIAETDVYALSWRAVTNDDDAIVGSSDAKVWRVMSAAELRGYPNPAAFRRDYSTNGELGERLLGRAFGEALEGSAKAGAGSFGVIVAPDGPLWLTRWERVRFDPRRLENVDLRGAPDPGRLTSLRPVLKPVRLGERDFGWRRAGVWCVPALAGEWRGPANLIEEFQLGVLVPGDKPNVISFRRRGAVMFGPVTDPTLTGDFGWTQFARSVRPEEIGYLFWDRRWSEEGWKPTPFTSFSLIQIP